MSVSMNVDAGGDQIRAHAERLLSEVKEENLAEFLHTLHHLHSPPPTSPQYAPLGIKPLDDILRISHPLSHTSNIYTPRQPVLEITSPSSADGKTHLLYYITAVAVLPDTYRNVALPGRNSAIVYLDTDFRFDAVRLREVAKGIVLERAAEQGVSLPVTGSHYEGGNGDGDGDDDIDQLLHTALSHVHIFRPQSSVSLLATIQSIEHYLLRGTGTVEGEGEGMHKHASHSRPLHSILLDSASAFYWQDRRELEVLNIPGVREERARWAQVQNQNQDHNDTETNTATFQSLLPHQIIHALRSLQHTFSCPLVFTTWGLLRAKPRTSYSTSHVLPASTTCTPLYTSHRPSIRPHLPRPWASFPTCRVIVQRDVVHPFAPFLTLEEAKREARERQRVVKKGRVVGWVDGHGSGRERDGERETMTERLFGFSLTGGGGIRWIDEDEYGNGDMEG
ncbi:Rad51 family DNA repair protein [Histoplasma capsulatum var. duboisii H88]|uniref:Rad51 family DNA repair protein n=1 Tax=Ajellomyces capsulatus (strain H88) TaxID=544711 RepID=F0UGW0_AJEC8|nr:Rad51 family DNA repair protein [Histoplasma capsulatum var. duboisii H88]